MLTRCPCQRWVMASVGDASRDTCNFCFLKSDRSLVLGKSSYKAEQLFRTDTTENHSSTVLYLFLIFNHSQECQIGSRTAVKAGDHNSAIISSLCSSAPLTPLLSLMKRRFCAHVAGVDGTLF